MGRGQNGRWLALCNPSLTQLIQDYIGRDFVKELMLIQGIRDYVDDAEFRTRWRESKLENKRRLTAYIRDTLKIEVSPSAVFDSQIKRIHEYKRQLLNIL